MPLFLSESERTALAAASSKDPVRPFYWALINRVERRAASPGLGDHGVTADWWHHAAEYLTDAAMVHATLYKPSLAVDAWLRDVTLSIARRPVDDWIGPSFRDHDSKPPSGHLETAHLTWGVAVVLDLAADLFTESERIELSTTLSEKGLVLCANWLDSNHHLANWRCVLNAGLAVAAAVLDDKPSIDRAAAEFHRCADIFQPDGSYAESIQYGNYAAYCMMIAREALVRRDPALDSILPLAPYAKKPRWDAASFFYQKPLSGWGAYPRPRSANFNDSAALYRPSADLLLHIAVRARTALPVEAGLARWLFDSLYLPCIEQSPHDLATFGFVNDFGFLTLPLLVHAPAALSPESAGVPLAAAFSCGDVLARDAWPEHGGRTILAVHGAGEALHGPGHLHGDLNSFILVHNRERLLLDPGHSCYRNLIHDLECSSLSHNTCTFSVEADSGLRLHEDLLKGKILQQSRDAKRYFDRQTGVSAPPVPRGGKRLLLARDGDVTAIASEVAALYGAPLTEFTRFWFLCGPHVLFVVDRIVADRPVKTSWSWLLNNRDDQLDLKLIRPDRLVARRGHAGMKLFHLGGGTLEEPLHAYVHDAYHPRTNQLGEGQPGSGSLVRWTEKTAATARTVVHAIAVDNPGATAGWHLKTGENFAALESPGADALWKLETAPDASRFVLTESVSGKTYTIAPDCAGVWKLGA
ncbi:MAG: heparinase II/III family protein [Opitutaceae bacterium]|jgi:hypothetical protein